MRKFTLFSASFIALALSLSVSACTDDGGADAETTAETTGDGDGDPTGDGDGAGDGDGDPTGGACYEQPAECALLVGCISALFPDMQASVEENYGPGGNCWCGTEAEAQDCFETCVLQVDAARGSFPTEPACHASSCGIDELDPTQPYGPVDNGSCPDYTTAQGTAAPQMPIMNPVGVPGSYCAPKCSGLANYCPDSNQTSAIGTCYLTVGQDNYCISRCYVDSEVVGGTQCQCGATCQPSGSDGEGNMRGICTFE